MSETIDIVKLKSNCTHFSKKAGAIDVLKRANGRTGYKAIARSIGKHHTSVSRLLKEAERLGLVVKRGQYYKKAPGIIQYCKASKRTFARKETITLGALSRRVSQMKRISGIDKIGSTVGQKSVERMTKAYAWLYITENALRELIRSVLNNEKDWWKNRVNQSIQSKVKEAMDTYPYDGAKRKDELEYTHLTWLKEIIISKRNWPMFIPRLREKDKSSFNVIVDKAKASRNSIAHCTPLTDEDYKFVEIRFKDILKMIN